MDRKWLLTPIPLVTALVAPFSGSISDRIGSRLPASIGFAIMAAGLLSLATLSSGFGPLDLVWRLALVGVGQGLFMSPNSSAILGSVPRARIGTASARTRAGAPPSRSADPGPTRASASS